MILIELIVFCVGMVIAVIGGIHTILLKTDDESVLADGIMVGIGGIVIWMVVQHWI